jgi:hypothetical protein
VITRTGTRAITVVRLWMPSLEVGGSCASKGCQSDSWSMVRSSAEMADDAARETRCATSCGATSHIV